MQKSKLLLVDDEPNLTSALVRSLDRTKFEIFTADSAQKGLMILAGNDIDVVVSDERMPGMRSSDTTTSMSLPARIMRPFCAESAVKISNCERSRLRTSADVRFGSSSTRSSLLFCMTDTLKANPVP